MALTNFFVWRQTNGVFVASFCAFLNKKILTISFAASCIFFLIKRLFYFSAIPLGISTYFFRRNSDTGNQSFKIVATVERPYYKKQSWPVYFLTRCRQSPTVFNHHHTISNAFFCSTVWRIRFKCWEVRNINTPGRPIRIQCVLLPFLPTTFCYTYSSSQIPFFDSRL